MKRYFVLAAAFALAGCATASGTPNGPHGRPIYSLEGPYASMLFNKASEKCPSGYEFVSAPSQDGYGAHHATIECK